MTQGTVTGSPTGPILDLADRIEKLLQHQASNPRQRILVALAGVPGSGKSTVSQGLLEELAVRGVQDVAIVPMVGEGFFNQEVFQYSLPLQDGFHYTKKALLYFEDPVVAFQRRGAPFTFDANAFLSLVKTLESIPVTGRGEPEQSIYAPSFDHAVQDPVENDIAVSSRNRIIVIEGNYTLLNQEPWHKIADICDERFVQCTQSCEIQLTVSRWFVDVSPEIVRDRLAARHLAAGIETSYEAAVKRAETNDIPNGEMIRSLLIKPDVVINN
jgi:pantothenate kinase